MSSDSLYSSCKSYGRQTPSKNVFKNPSPTQKKKKKNSTTRLFNLIYCGWIWTKSISILQSNKINKITPHFTSIRRAQNADTHALKQHRLSQNISPDCISFVLVIASDMHLEPEREKRSKTLIFTQLNTSSYKQNFFAIFRRILQTWTLTYLL